ncbi:MAG: four-carbon acid sugar kinase family protein [Opitutales bacterium]
MSAGSCQIAFYGDDFTGSTDALECLTRAGLDPILFLEAPTPERWKAFAGRDAFGVAGLTRSLPPDPMAGELTPAFERIRAIGPRHLHYKVCSTFDSSPEIGNIARAIAVGRAIFENPVTPVVPPVPHLGRYCAFGNLFARQAIKDRADIHRLDRHPSMRDHPTTPAHEADLRLHLAAQGTFTMGLFDLLDLARPAAHRKERVRRFRTDGTEVLFFDGLYPEHMPRIGEALDVLAEDQATLFSVGSSGVDTALGEHWAATDQVIPRTDWQPLKPAGTVLVLAGSVSPVTARQIETARAAGFVDVPVAPDVLEDPDRRDARIAESADRVARALKGGRSVLVHTCEGPSDERLQACRRILAGQGLDQAGIRGATATRFGEVLGRIGRDALGTADAGRLIVAGGDTSSRVARHLGVEAVEMTTPLYPGAPLCRALAPDSPVDGMELNFKGGQVGDDLYFAALLAGKRPS